MTIESTPPPSPNARLERALALGHEVLERAGLVAELPEVGIARLKGENMLARLSLALLGGFLMLALLHPFRRGTDIDVVAGLTTSMFINELIQRKHEAPVRRWTRAAISALVIGVGFWALKTWVHR